ncbi:hypothetical protein ACWESM_36250, partial [Nocardia sp. NPDC003999]
MLAVYLTATSSRLCLFFQRLRRWVFAAPYGSRLRSGSIKHWPNQRKGLAEMIRVLRPGGLLLVIE